MNESVSQTKAEAAIDKEIGTKREQLDFSVMLPEENVSKILSASASVSIENFEALLGEVSFSGEACLNIVYSLEDGTISNHKMCQDFSGKFENIAFDPSSLVRIIPNVLDVSIEKGVGNSIKVKISLENSFSIVKNQEIGLYSNTDDSIFVKESQIELLRHSKRNCYNFVQNSVFETKLPVGKILNVTGSVVVNKADALDGIVVFEGETITKLFYATEDDRPLLVSLVNKDMFREEVEDENSARENIVEGYACVTNKDIEETVNAENKTIEISVPVKICYDLFEMNGAVVCDDAYSTEKEINLTTEAFISTELVKTEVFDNKIDGNVTLDEDTLRIDKILAVDGAYLTPQVETYQNGELQSEGLIHLNIIYLNDEEENVNSVSIEIPYAFKEKVGEDENLRVRTNSQIIEIDATAKRGRDIYVDGKIKTQVWLLKDKENAVVSEIVEGEKYAERDSAIEIYFAEEGKTFWDVAKELHVSEDDLKEQNKEIAEPFAAPEKIVFFEQYKVDMD